eukprot:gene2749-2926_t
MSMFPSNRKSPKNGEKIQDIPVYKFIVVGDTCVGKTSILDRYIDDKMAETNVSTIGCDYKRRTILVGEELVSLAIWDTAGQERFRSLVKNYYHGAQGIVFVYDITNRRSFDNLVEWMREVDESVDLQTSMRILLGNKCDLADRRQVSYEQGQSHQLDFVEVSAVSANNINAAFLLLVQQVHLKSTGKLKKKKKSVTLSSSSSIGEDEPSSTSCCDCGFTHQSKAKRKNSLQYQTSIPDSKNPLLSSASDGGDSTLSSLVGGEDDIEQR